MSDPSAFDERPAATLFRQTCDLRNRARTHRDNANSALSVYEAEVAKAVALEVRIEMFDRAIRKLEPL
ncbi:hypothetical protein [Brevundimonas sp.]|uniref:hypothetical protein n=1 Tax=Brevundimonas sp. TaxID=1871086 RepID=UPI00286B079D|nr:hypothetical protein [Brevundimonas sp.]